MRTSLRAAAAAALVLALSGCSWFGLGAEPTTAPTAAVPRTDTTAHATLKYEPAPVPPRQFFEQ